MEKIALKPKCPSFLRNTGSEKLSKTEVECVTA